MEHSIKWEQGDRQVSCRGIGVGLCVVDAAAAGLAVSLAVALAVGACRGHDRGPCRGMSRQVPRKHPRAQSWHVPRQHHGR